MITDFRPKAAAPALCAAAKRRSTGKNHTKAKAAGSNGSCGEPRCLLLELVREAKAEVAKCGVWRAIPRLDELEATLINSLPTARSGCSPLPVASPQAAEKDAGYDPKKAAQILGMTARKLSRRCQDRNGCSCGQLVRKAQMQAGAEMLRKGRPVKEVAIALHYRNPANFSRSFKQAYKMSPWEYARGTSTTGEAAKTCPEKAKRSKFSHGGSGLLVKNSRFG